MDIEPQVIFRDVLVVFLRDDECLYAGLLGAIGFFKYTADGTYASLQ